MKNWLSKNSVYIYWSVFWTCAVLTIILVPSRKSSYQILEEKSIEVCNPFRVVAIVPETKEVVCATANFPAALIVKVK